jgi:hypothetical protein
MEETTAKTPGILNGFFTLRNEETGEHRTFRVRTQAEKAKFAPGSRVIGLLTGPDNEADYTGFGFVINGDRVAVWKSRRGHGDGWALWSKWEKLAHMFTTLVLGRKSPHFDAAKYSVKLAKRCLRCNRPLTDPISIDLGIGPVCRTK